MSTNYLCIFNKCFFHHKSFNNFSTNFLFSQNEHVEINKFHVVSHVHR